MSDEIDVLGPPPETSEDRGIVAEAVRLFFAERKGAGDLLPWEWLYAALQLPDPEQLNDISSYRWHQLRFLVLRKKFETEMLTVHRTAFDTVIGKGVVVVAPGDQTPWAKMEMSAELRRAMSKGSARLRHVNLGALDARQKAQNADALASFASLRSMLRSQLRRLDQLNGGADDGD